MKRDIGPRPSPPPGYIPPRSAPDRIADALERIAAAMEGANERDSYDAALARWKAGQGKHPDD